MNYFFSVSNSFTWQTPSLRRSLAVIVTLLFLSFDANISSAVAFFQFVNGFRLELMHIFPIVSIRWGSTISMVLGCLYCYHVIEITSLFFTCRLNLLCIKRSSDRLLNIAAGFSSLPNLIMLIKEKSLLLPRNFALVAFGKLLLVFPTKQNLYFLYLITLRSIFIYGLYLIVFCTWQGKVFFSEIMLHSCLKLGHLSVYEVSHLELI